MAAVGSHLPICRSIWRLSGFLCRKKDSTSVFRVFAWLVAILAFLTVALVYTGFQSRGEGSSFLEYISEGALLKNHFIPLVREDLPVTKMVHVDLPSTNANQTVGGKKNPEVGAQSPEKSLEKMLEEAAGLDTREDDRKKSLLNLLGVQGASGNSKPLETLAAGDTRDSGGFDANGVLQRMLQHSRDGPAATRFGRGVVDVAKETTTSAGRTEPASKFECPSNFTMTDSDNLWFRTAIVQSSPHYRVTNDDVTDDVLILTPISNVRRHLWKYFENLCSLTYPHRHISIVLGEDSSSDFTFETAERLAAEVRPYFKRVQVLRLKGSSSQTSGHARHDRSWQLNRRRHLAMARNQLLFGALGGGSEKWVLWMDSDVRHIPSDLVERLLSPQKQIVAANCLYRQDNGRTDTFDRNTWRDTEASKRRLQQMPDDFLMLEGYGETERKFLNDLKGEGDVVRLDGVGGCVLLVEADLHRKGLVFPAFIFDHHVETEGLAKMAARLGVEMYGLPSVNVIHW